jgi:hypothetical protein
MAFRWLGTFRQGSWRAYRRFILEERRDVGERMSVIRSELTRIGDVEIIYASTTDDEGVTTVTETRLGFSVTPGSSLAKLVQAYVAQGGNPFDISMFLTPDQAVVLDDTDPDQAATESQPSGGVMYPKSGTYTPGERFKGGDGSLKKDYTARVGGPRVVPDASIGISVDMARKWLRQEIRTKRDDIEHRIIKLCDLREQLNEELEAIVMAAAGVSSEIPLKDEVRFDTTLSVANIVATIDSLFYTMDETNTPDFSTPNEEALGSHPNLLDDDDEEANTAL